MTLRSVVALSGALAFAISSVPAVAHEAGDWIVRAGVHYIDPKSNNHKVVEVDAATMVSFNLTYMMTRNWGVEVLGSLPFEHDIGLVDGPTVASTKHLPPTVSLVYSFLPDSPVQPYVGVGLNVTLFFSEDTKGPLADSKLELRTSVGAAAAIGVDIAQGNDWFLNADVRYIDIETDARLRTAGETTRLGTVEIDPWAAGVTVGYRF